MIKIANQYADGLCNLIAGQPTAAEVQAEDFDAWAEPLKKGFAHLGLGREILTAVCNKYPHVHDEIAEQVGRIEVLEQEIYNQFYEILEYDPESFLEGGE